MPLDTSAKRNSALLDPWGVLPFPDGEIDASDRLTLLGQYSGIAAGAVLFTGPPPGTAIGHGALTEPTGRGAATIPSGRGRLY